MGHVKRVRRLSRAWRWPLGGLVLSAVGALFVPVGTLLWLQLCVTVGAIITLVRIAHREVPFPIAVAQWRLGGDHPEVLRARAMTAAMALQQGQAGLAVHRLEHVLPDLVRVLGPDHPDTLSARSLNLQVRGEHGGLPDRLAAVADLIEDLTRVLGPGHPDTLAARYCRAEWLSQDGRTDEAETAFGDLIATATESVGPDSDITLVARSSLTILRHERSGATPADKAAAVDELTAVLDAMDRALGTDNPTTASTRRLLGQWRSTRTDPMLPPVD
ncbi:tetratricopeptide repeat protein [Streptomyces triticiradicis]|uniref:tetratricopeptide repeat protein n=1 Tax=Streptomyces triticiradicis TaxID=2651189 RepID=UPI001CEDAAF6|nr:tetratricopeptide repeat protein [Streptomyces triticiradicis]